MIKSAQLGSATIHEEGYASKRAQAVLGQKGTVCSVAAYDLWTTNDQMSARNAGLQMLRPGSPKERAVRIRIRTI
jgi:hypothetical protein